MKPLRKPRWPADAMARAATMLSILLSLFGTLLALRVLLQVLGLAEGGR
jgi:hypothetical protein